MRVHRSRLSARLHRHYQRQTRVVQWLSDTRLDLTLVPEDIGSAGELAIDRRKPRPPWRKIRPLYRSGRRRLTR